MTDRPDLTTPVDDLEGRLRTLLSDRAATVSGPAPDLPVIDGPALRGAVAPARPRHRGRVAAAVAAAAAVLLGAAVLVRGPADEPEELRSAAPPPTAAGLPDGFDPATAGRVMRINTDRDPEVAARRYLRWRLTEPGATPDEVVDGLQLTAGEQDGAIVPVTWKRADGSTGGTVIVRIGKLGSDIVASTTPGVDLAEVHMEGSSAVGQVRTTEAAPPGPALVDVLAAGHALPAAPTGEPGTPEFHGYGSAATGDRAFSVDVGEYDPIVSARFIDGHGAVRTIAELALDAPDSPEPDLSAMSPEEVQTYLDELPPDPRCVAADAAATSSGGQRSSASRTASGAPLFDLPPSASPQDAVEALAEAMDLEATDVTITSPLSSGGVAGTRFGAAPVEVMIWEDDDGFTASEVTTPAACWGAGGGKRPSPGSASTPVWFSRIAGAQSGDLWYQTDDGSTWTAPLGPGDVRSGKATVAGEDRPIEVFAVVVRDTDGEVVLVQRTTL